MNEKLSFYIIAKNEIFWIEPCILSIKHLTDDIVYVDNGSTDGTLEKVKLIKNTYKLPINIFEYPKECDLSELRNFALSKCKHKWVFVWDADFIAYEDTSSFSTKKFLEDLDKNKTFEKFNEIDFQCPIMRAFMGKSYEAQIKHVPNCYIMNKDEVSITMSNKNGWDARHYKTEAKRRTSYDFCFISLDIKSDLHCTKRRFRCNWRMYRKEKNSNISLDDYIKTILKFNLEDASFIYNRKYIKFPYPIPTILHTFINNPPYKLILKDNKIIGREFDYVRLKKLEIKI